MILSRINLYKLEMESSIVIVRTSYEYITILKRYQPKCSGDENATQRELMSINIKIDYNTNSCIIWNNNDIILM